MVAFVTSLIITAAMVGIFYLYAARRPADLAPSWGEAMIWAAFMFTFIFWIYGVVPHQFLTWADNELNWRPDKLLFGPGDIVKPQAEGGWLPFTLSYLILRDILVVILYNVLLGLNLKMFIDWQVRGDKLAKADAIVPASSYGRPLVKEGAKA